MKRIIYRFACWLEYRALDLQGWSEPEAPSIDLQDLVIGGINRDPVTFWNNAVQNNALLNRLSKEK